MCGLGDEQVGDPAPMGATGLDDSGYELTVATRGNDIEGNRFESRLELLQSSLPTGSLGASRGEMGTCGQLSEGDSTDRCVVGECRADIRVVPIDDDDVSSSPVDIYRLWSTMRSRSDLNCSRSTWGPEAASAMRSVFGTKVRRSRRIGRNSATGTPLRVTTKVSPDATASMTFALSLRSWR